MNGVDGYGSAARGPRSHEEVRPLVLVGGETHRSLTWAAQAYRVSTSIIAEAWNDRVPVAAVVAARNRRAGLT
ncbi:hypothetical protein [Albimonas pacifica]|uniref:Uncharacterized protein n=1 Tax=Albimonas pacifica TaxID=1114924 RepID=A0A1I3JJE7_9RHOB|nr:hypothetical protein [Albimonas pacifica]SFI60377.1 hypothetical protein SAMN05216258_10833 [Albimonas pacifica]